MDPSRLRQFFCLCASPPNDPGAKGGWSALNGWRPNGMAGAGDGQPEGWMGTEGLLGRRPPNDGSIKGFTEAPPLARLAPLLPLGAARPLPLAPLALPLAPLAPLAPPLGAGPPLPLGAGPPLPGAPLPLPLANGRPLASTTGIRLGPTVSVFFLFAGLPLPDIY